jgi:hypothetical protein
MKQPNTVEVAHGEKIHCPICNQVVIDLDQAEDGEYFQVCDHTLYVAHDMGIDYASDPFKQISDAAGADLDDEEVDPREIMKTSGIDAVYYFETYVPAPSFYGTYVAFHKK